MNQPTKLFRPALYAAALVAMLTLPAAAVQPQVAAQQLKAMSGVAKTSPENTGIGKQEVQNKKIAQPAGVMVYKWPAMANGFQQANEKVVQVRRTVAESR